MTSGLSIGSGLSLGGGLSIKSGTSLGNGLVLHGFGGVTPPPPLNAPTITVVQGTGAPIPDNGSTTDQVLTVTVSLSGTNAIAGDLLRLFDAGVQTGLDYTLLSGDILAGTASDATGTLAVSGTAHTLTAKLVRAGVPTSASNIWHVTVTAPPASVTWDPAALNANVVLSNGNLTASSGTAGSNQNYCGVSTVAITAGQKKYAEITATLANTTITILGVANATFPFTDGHYLGIDTAGIGADSAGDIFYNNGAVGSIGAGYVQGDVIAIAVDFDAALIWWRVNGGNWNGSALANPALGIGGQAIGITGDLFWAYCLNYDGATENSLTGKFSASFAGTVPVGFSGQ